VEDCLAWSGRRPVQWLLNTHRSMRAGAWCMPPTSTRRSRLRWHEAARWLGCARPRKPISATAVPLRGYLDAAAALVSAATAMSRPVRSRNCAGWNTSVASRRGRGTFRNCGKAPRSRVAAGARVGWRRAGVGARKRKDRGGMCGRPGVLDPGHPALVGRRGDGLLDGWVFQRQCDAGAARDGAGTVVVRDGRHRDGARIRSAFGRTMRRLAEAW